MGDETRWLDEEQQRSWRALMMGMTLLDDRLDADLRAGFDISLSEYEILVRLSENDGAMRMAQLADSLAHSRSRITHTITRMERSGLVERRNSADDGRGVVAALSDRGFEVLREAAPVHVSGVREYLVDLVSEEDFAALGRVMNAVSDYLICDRPGIEMR
ncbi:MarR family transcriptional regulator [Nocardioides sp.]|uniref:MarR family winged helix-turn-helix transcriptional regulator n=1 Tax=Nocardioides sp. TaxID=35761 RepID=UPI0019B288D8|nr:MarR family transcriptional regulator [Nocardioides sp.]MBC7277783.1 MarR family transcriptional regulator [Nocardioides sp.]